MTPQWAMGILAEDARDAFFVHRAEIEHMHDPSRHPGEDPLDVRRHLELLEDEPERVLAVNMARRDGGPRLITAEIQHTIGRRGLLRNMEQRSDGYFHGDLLPPLRAHMRSPGPRYRGAGGMRPGG